MYYLAFINIITFSIYGLDKYKAKKKKRRIREKKLLFLSILGGAYCGYISMFIFHHKTKKIKFHLINIILIIIYSYIFFKIINNQLKYPPIFNKN